MEKNTSHIFIIKSRKDGLKSVEQYLLQKKYHIQSSHLLREAIAYIMQHKPNIVLVPVNPKNKQLQTLPRLLAQAFPCTVVAYVEVSTPKALSALHSLHLDYVLYSNFSGESVERLIQRIERDNVRKNGGTPAEIARKSSDNNLPDKLVIKEPELKAKKSIDGAMSEDEKKALQALIDMRNSKAAAQQFEPIEEDPEALPDQDMVYTEAEMKAAGFNLETGEAEKTEAKFDQGEAEKVDYQYEKSEGKKPTYEYEQSEKAEDDLVYPESSTDKKENIRQLKDSEFKTLIRRASKSALEKVTDKQGSEIVQKIGWVQNAVCIVVESTRFNGYLIAAASDRQKLDDLFFPNIEKYLFAFLRANGENVLENHQQMVIKISDVDFEDWALEQAEFLEKTIHKSNEVALAFFPSKTTSLELHPSIKSHMLKVDLGELREDVPVDFDLYLYMNENSKYILYTPKGSTLFKNQKDRLVDKGVAHMHLKREDSQNVRRYHAQNFLNDKIKEFHKKKKRTSA